uniref:Uncharacterized protein n=1 Tax=Rousettus aegyptiacus TaxID=9407 RepID=A0A7J8BF47_ROUAE|nr:hypothetical protein HJG63_009733 [Rousettus aegyptiacus]
MSRPGLPGWDAACGWPHSFLASSLSPLAMDSGTQGAQGALTRWGLMGKDDRTLSVFMKLSVGGRNESTTKQAPTQSAQECSRRPAGARPGRADGARAEGFDREPGSVSPWCPWCPWRCQCSIKKY